MQYDVTVAMLHTAFVVRMQTFNHQIYDHTHDATIMDTGRCLFTLSD